MKYLKPVLLGLGILTTLVACKETRSDIHAEQLNHAEHVAIVKDDRVDVRRVGMVKDELAYGGYRGIYRVTDRATGREYVGISGVGISELAPAKSDRSGDRERVDREQ